MIARLSDQPEQTEPTVYRVNVRYGPPPKRTAPFDAGSLVDALMPHLRRASILAEIQELEQQLQGARNQAAITRKPRVAEDCYVEIAGLHYRLAEAYMTLLPAERRGEIE